MKTIIINKKKYDYSSLKELENILKKYPDVQFKGIFTLGSYFEIGIYFTAGDRFTAGETGRAGKLVTTLD